MFIGLDFGTTNSALALTGSSGPARLVQFGAHADAPTTFRSILYFDADEKEASGRPLCFAGPAAVAAYLEHGAAGRLVQSIKSYLTNREFTSTNIFGSRYALENLIALVVAGMIDAAPDAVDLIERLKSAPVVVGRPARFVRSTTASDDADTFAVARLTEALKGAGVPDVSFELEPVAAAYSYEERIGYDEVVLIGDFGGGTSDFCLLHVGPGARKAGNREETIIGVSGVGIAGDAFDARIVERCLAPRLGQGSSYLSTGRKRLPMPLWLYDSLRRWHQLSFINTYKTRKMLSEIEAGAETPDEIAALAGVIRDNRGFDMYRAVERTKVALSARNKARLEFRAPPISIAVEVERGDFESWIEPELTSIAECIDRLVEETGFSPAKIDRVFLTGGSSFLPAVRRLFVDRFGQAKLAGGNELTSVATGLALAARDRFAA